MLRHGELGHTRSHYLVARGSVHGTPAQFSAAESHFALARCVLSENARHG